jgi:hypothetical protein
MVRLSLTHGVDTPSVRLRHRLSQASEGKRVVFVSVRGRDGGLPRTRRKRALGVADDATWETFQQLVCSRLSLRGVKAIYHSAGGTQLRSLEDLQDIEDLEVEECDEAAAGAGASSTPMRKAAAVHVTLPPSVPAGGGEAGGGEDEDKYARRGGALPSLLARLLPSWASLPLASAPAKLRDGLKDASDVLREATTGRRRKARGCTTHLYRAITIEGACCRARRAPGG